MAAAISRGCNGPRPEDHWPGLAFGYTRGRSRPWSSNCRVRRGPDRGPCRSPSAFRLAPPVYLLGAGSGASGGSAPDPAIRSFGFAAFRSRTRSLSSSRPVKKRELPLKYVGTRRPPQCGVLLPSTDGRADPGGYRRRRTFAIIAETQQDGRLPRARPGSFATQRPPAACDLRYPKKDVRYARQAMGASDSRVCAETT